MYSRQPVGKNDRKRGVKGYDGAKKVKGRKRHIITDSQGLILGCYVGAANENDRDGIKPSLDNVTNKYPTINKMWSDMGYQGEDLRDDIKNKYGINLEIVKRPPCRFWVHKDTPLELLPHRESGFKVQKRRWVVERTFAWINRNRRLSKEYDFLTQSSENMIYLAMNRLMLKRVLQ
jgi:transposase